ncbi:MAG: hypothetical protein ABEJ61_09870 [Haloferacaceae archaeon]
MTDPVSIFLGNLLWKTIVVSAVVVAMQFTLVGEFLLAAGLVVPLALFLALFATDGVRLE